MRDEDAWYSVRVLSWKLGKENPLPVTVRTTSYTPSYVIAPDSKDFTQT